MTRVVLITTMLLTLGACNQDINDSELRLLTATVNDVGRELSDLGFPVNPADINIEVREAKSMAALFDDINQAAQQELVTDSTIHKNNSRLAFYDANTQTLIFKSGAADELTRGQIAHELAHVYQDQKWGLNNIWQTYNNNPTNESFNILQFITEGHAELARYAYEQANAKNPVAISDLSLTLGKIFNSECVVCHGNNSVSNLPYSMGMRFLAHQYKLGGWPLVEQNLLNPPTSTEQILHPSKFTQDEPLEINLPSWAEQNNLVTLENSAPMGEAYLLTKLANLNVPNIEAFTSASGWDGDMANQYLLPNNKTATTWRIVFDRKVDATQLENTLDTYDKNNLHMRVGRVIDWIISEDQDAIDELRIFLSKHPISLASDKQDEISTSKQETYTSQPMRRTSILLGPNK